MNTFIAGGRFQALPAPPVHCVLHDGDVLEAGRRYYFTSAAANVCIDLAAVGMAECSVKICTTCTP